MQQQGQDIRAIAEALRKRQQQSVPTGVRAEAEALRAQAAPPREEQEESPGAGSRFVRAAVGNFFGSLGHMATAPFKGIGQLAQLGAEVAPRPIQAVQDIARGSDAIIPGLTDQFFGPGAAGLVSEIARNPLQAATDINRGADAFEVPSAEELGGAAGQLGALGFAGLGGRALGRTNPQKPGGFAEVELPSGRTVSVPTLRSERTGGAAASRLESVSRRVAGGRKVFEKFEQGRTDLLIDEAAAGVARDVAGVAESSVRAGTAFQNSMARGLDALKERAGVALSAAEEAAIARGVPVARPNLFAFMRKIERKQMGAKRGGAVAPANLKAAQDVLKSDPVMAAEGAFEMLKVLRDKARGSATSEFPGLTGGQARGAAAALKQDIFVALKNTDPLLARQWGVANARFARAAQRFEMRAIKKILAADEEAIPGVLAKIPIRQIQHARLLAGPDKFNRAVGKLIENTYLKGVAEESLVHSGLAAQSGTAAQLERTISARTVSRSFENLAQDGRLRALAGEKAAAAIQETNALITRQAESMRVRESSLIANTIDSAVLRVTVPAIGAGVVGTALGMGPGLQLLSAGVAAIPVSVELAAYIYARIATNPAGNIALRNAVRTIGTPKNGAASAALGAALMRDEEIRRALERERQ